MPAQSDKKQARLLIGVVLCILAVVAFNFRDRFVPMPALVTEVVVAPMDVPAGLSLGVFDRKDFQSLVGQEAVPVRPLQKGSPDVFTISPSGQQ